LARIDDFATWEPLLRPLWVGNVGNPAFLAGPVSGQISVDGGTGWTLPTGSSVPAEDAGESVRSALADAGLDGISFTARFFPDGRVVLDRFSLGAAVEASAGGGLGSIILVEGSVPEPWRRLPDPVPRRAPAPSVDLALLERKLREGLPDAVGCTEAEIVAAEARLGVVLPDELKVFYRVTRMQMVDIGDGYLDYADPVMDVLGFEPFPLDGLSPSTAADRPFEWESGAQETAATPPGAAVQALAGSPGWIVFADNGGGDKVAVDLTPGPGGHTGQVILIPHDMSTGAELIADSLTSLVREPEWETEPARGGHEPPVVARVGKGDLRSPQAAAHPGLEVLLIGEPEDEPQSLAAVIGLPRLRTLIALPGTLADPLEIAGLTGLEFLKLGPEEWQVLLDAGTVPRSLSAAAIDAYGITSQAVGIANELLALWNRPTAVQAVLEGHLA
jgi:cell wall assembly regulator SMI1